MMLEFSYMANGLTRLVFTFVIAAGISLLAFGWSCSPPEHSGPVQSITIGATPNELNTLIYVADEQGYFLDNDIEIKYKDYDTGVAAVDGLLKGEVDIALTMEFVIVGNVFQKQKILDLATIDKALTFYLVVPKDRGIISVADLKGKKIGIPRRTIMEFFLGRMLEFNGIGMQDVNTVDMQASDTPREISSRNVDAVVAFEPNVTNISRQMGDAVHIWAIQSSQTSYWSVVSTRNWVSNHLAETKNFLKSIVKAEQYVLLHDQETKTMIKNRFNYDDKYMNSVWPRNQFSVFLDQSLITAMEDQARWMIHNKLTTEMQVPDFLDYIYEDALKAIKPEAVKIIR